MTGMDFAQLPKSRNPNFVTMGKLGERGELLSATVHLNQVAVFQGEGWLIPPSEQRAIPVVRQPTETELRAHDTGDIELLSDSEQRERAGKDPDVRDTLLARAAVDAALKHPDPDKVRGRLRGLGKI